jgi:hypothetical protein
MTTYLQAVNDVLVRLREEEVSTVNENAYSKLIGKLINDAKRSVEDAHTWNALGNTLSAVTTANVFNYVLVGAGQRFKVLNVFDDGADAFLTQRESNWMAQNLLKNTVLKGRPSYFNFNGVDANGDTQVDLYPVPDDVYTIRFNLYIPQDTLSSDSAVIAVPSEPVILGAYARAIAERGEDTGLSSADAYGLYRSSLSDAIAIDNGHFVDNEIWISV